MSKPWSKKSTRVLGEYPVFKLRCDRLASPRNGHELDAFVLETGPWITIVPTTPDNQVIFVKQYRFGIEDFTLETPGGLMDSVDDTPLTAACRELVEETGCVSDEVVSLGVVKPNPAIQNTICHVFWARNVQQTREQKLDPGEDILLETVPLDDIPDLIHKGVIQHSIVLNAFYLLELHQRREA